LLYAEDTRGLRFHPALAPTGEEMNDLVCTLERRIGRLLVRRGVVDGGDHGPDRWAEEAPVLAGIADAAVRDAPRSGRAPGPRCGGTGAA
jgi:hypothetical protein